VDDAWKAADKVKNNGKMNVDVKNCSADCDYFIRIKKPEKAIFLHGFAIMLRDKEGIYPPVMHKLWIKLCKAQNSKIKIDINRFSTKNC
jgi:putative aminopeptidase FrvX